MKCINPNSFVISIAFVKLLKVFGRLSAGHIAARKLATSPNLTAIHTIAKMDTIYSATYSNVSLCLSTDVSWLLGELCRANIVLLSLPEWC